MLLLISFSLGWFLSSALCSHSVWVFVRYTVHTRYNAAIAQVPYSCIVPLDGYSCGCKKTSCPIEVSHVHIAQELSAILDVIQPLVAKENCILSLAGSGSRRLLSAAANMFREMQLLL